MKPQHLIFKDQKSEAVKALLVVLLLSSIYSVCLVKSAVGVSIGVFLGIVALYFLFTSSGLILDLENKRYNRSRIFRNRPMGAWINLPEVSYISVFKTQMVTTTRSITYRGLSMKREVVRVNLIYDKRQKLCVYESESSSQALEMAEHIATKLNLRIFDATTRDGQWMDEQQN